MANFTLGSASLGTEVDLSGLSDGLEEGRGLAERGGDSIGSTLGSAITKGMMVAGAAITTALAGIAGAGIISFMGFERQMNEVFTLLPGISQQAMGAMSDQVKTFSTDFGVLPEQVIPALYEALSAGVPPDNVFDFIAVAQKAAIGGVTDVKTTVDGLTSVTNAYGADVLSVGQASDQMFKAVAYGKTNFEQLSASLYNVVPTAAGLGIAFDQVSAALAAMTLQGVPTSVATTQLRSLFVELSKAGTDTSDTFTRIAGTGFTDFIAGGGTVQEALLLMEEAARQSGVGISDLFGSVEAGQAALALTGNGTEAFSGALDAVSNSAGATDAAFKTMDQGIGRSVDYIKASISVMLTNVGDKLAPTFQVFADWVQSHMPQIEAVIVRVFDTIGAMINAVLPYFSAFASVASGAFGVFIDIATQAGQWGLEIGRQLAGGLMSAASYVVESLNYLGSLFTDLLEPHSPPKLLPHIDDWGTETAQVWIDGWTAADFDAFDRIAAVAQKALDGIDGVDIKSLLYGPEGSLQSAISELATTGSISATTFAAIRSGAGSAGAGIESYLRGMVALEQASRAAAAAQDELNAITEKYEACLLYTSDAADE